jgi:hypothetical protein
VVDYIHLNPVRAGIVTAEQLAGFRWSSLRRFREEGRPDVLVCADWLARHGWENSLSGVNGYVGYLTELARDEAAQKRLGLEKLSTGWAIGSEAWRREIAKDHAQRALDPGMEAGEIKALKQAHWAQILDAELEAQGKTREGAGQEIRSAPWKLAVAARLRRAGAPYAWITDALHMGKASSVRAHLSKAKHSI